MCCVHLVQNSLLGDKLTLLHHELLGLRLGSPQIRALFLHNLELVNLLPALFVKNVDDLSTFLRPLLRQKWRAF